MINKGETLGTRWMNLMIILWLPSSNNNHIGRQEELSDQLMDLFGAQQPIVDPTSTIIRPNT
jgi:hypothetical protein